MNLIQNARELSQQWHATETKWRDAKAQQFAKSYLEPLPVLVHKTSNAMDELEILLRKIRKDCEQPH